MADFDETPAHRHFAATCFNSAWTYMDQANRSPDDEEEMLRRALASHFHWTQRDDYTPEKASVAYWQTSRVFALLGEAGLARRFGERARDVLGERGKPFFVAYAHEALARAAATAGDAATRAEHLAAAEALLPEVAEDSRGYLKADLDSVPEA